MRLARIALSAFKTQSLVTENITREQPSYFETHQHESFGSSFGECSTRERIHNSRRTFLFFKDSMAATAADQNLPETHEPQDLVVYCFFPLQTYAISEKHGIALISKVLMPARNLTNEFLPISLVCLLQAEVAELLALFTPASPPPHHS